MKLNGYVHPGFRPVAEEFIKRIADDDKSGSALSIYHHGECVVDIWAGCADFDGNPWREDTLALSFSTTKGVAATLLHILADQGVIEYDRPVSYYWPEFHGAGKQDVTVRHVLSHQSGLYNIRSMIDDAMLMTDWDHMIKVLEQAPLAHPPGHEHGYHGLTFGWLIGEIMQRATGLSFSQLLEQELTKPLQLDGCYVGLPESEMGRRALLVGHGRESRPPRESKRKPRSKSVFKKAQGQFVKAAFRFAGLDAGDFTSGLAPKGISRFSFNDPRVVQSCIPAANGMFTARSLARIYAMLAGGGELGGKRVMSENRVRLLSEVQSRRIDRVVPVPMHWRLGYHRVFSTGPRTPHAFGHFGFGGSGAWCDPSRSLSLGFTVNSSSGISPFGDSRVMHIDSAAIRCAERLDGKRRKPQTLLTDRFYDLINT